MQFKDELRSLLNKYSKENGSNTPDWILAEYIEGCLEVFDKTQQKRATWYNSWFKNEILDRSGKIHGVDESNDNTNGVFPSSTDTRTIDRNQYSPI
jgi:hypothetical protein